MIFIKIKKLLKIIILCAGKLIKNRYIIIVVKIDFWEEFVVSPIIDNYKDNFINLLQLSNNIVAMKIKDKSVILISLYANEE